MLFSFVNDFFPSILNNQNYLYSQGTFITEQTDFLFGIQLDKEHLNIVFFFYQICIIMEGLTWTEDVQPPWQDWNFL